MDLFLFQLVLADRLDHLPASLREHFLLPANNQYKVVMEGEMDEVWHRPQALKPLLWLLSKANTLFPETGSHIPLRLENYSYIDSSGIVCMKWQRWFRFPTRERRFHAVMKYDQKRQLIVDYFGPSDFLAADLLVEPFFHEQQSGLLIRSGSYRLQLGTFSCKLPRWASPQAEIREWWEPDMKPNDICVEVRLHHPWIGDFFGYRGRFTVRREPI